MLYFSTTGSTVGLFTPSVATNLSNRLCYNITKVTMSLGNNFFFFNSIIVLWDDQNICVLLLTRISLGGACNSNFCCWMGSITRPILVSGPIKTKGNQEDGYYFLLSLVVGFQQSYSANPL